MKKNTVTFRTGAWYADREKEFTLPDSWKIHEYRMDETPALTDARLGKKLDTPIGSGSITAEAKGAKTAVIIVDDLSRPTPAEAICLGVMDRLNAAGIPDKKINILLGGGAHRPLSRPEMRRKVGKAMDRAGRTDSHDAYECEVTHLGVTSRQTPVLVNSLACADFKISVSGIYPLQVAGFGGGYKMIMPAVSHISSILWNHTRLATGTRAGNPADSERRVDIDEYGKIFGLNMIANAVVNSRREVCGLFCGHPSKAHRKGVAFARKAYYSGLDDGKKYDLTLANAYPLDYDAVQLCKTYWAQSTYKTPLLIVSEYRDPWWYHGQSDGWFRDFKKDNRLVKMPRQPRNRLMESDILVYNPNFGTRVFPRDVPWYFSNNWNKLMKDLTRRWPRARVRVMPYGSIQY